MVRITECRYMTEIHMSEILLLQRKTPTHKKKKKKLLESIFYEYCQAIHCFKFHTYIFLPIFSVSFVRMDSAKNLKMRITNKNYRLQNIFEYGILLGKIANKNIYFEPRHEKTCLCHMRTTKAQISLRICAV